MSRDTKPSQLGTCNDVQIKTFCMIKWSEKSSLLGFRSQTRHLPVCEQSVEDKLCCLFY